MALAVGHGFDHHRGRRLQCQLACFCDGGMYCEEIVSVHANAGHSISRSTRYDAITSILIFYRSRNSVPVIPAKENHWRLERSGKVTRRVEVDGRRRTFAKVNNRNRRFLPRIVRGVQFELVRRSHRLRNLGPQRTGHRLIIQRAASVMHRHLPSLAQIQIVGEALVAKLVQGEAAPHEDAGLAVLREDEVVGLECRCRSHVNRLFAVLGHVE
mmetsp:Transcript_30884/g.66739  ORF Transcript_30884/g.66739 Transcript_30884/m.66739 type:complete len:213 (-) Transcript_30884:1160-1798(-)